MSDAGLLTPVRNVVRAVWTLPPFLARHAWRSRIVERSHLDVERLSDDPPPDRHHPRLQPRSAGVGPVMMRTYSVDMTDAVLSPDELIDELRIDPNHLTSNLVAGFVRDDRPARCLDVDDEVVVELPGPWDGPCRVDSIDTHRIVMSTLDGHLEAGHIAFETVPAVNAERTSSYTFRVRSWARAGDAGFAALHLAVPIGKELQTAMWCAMCERAVVVAGARRDGPINVATEELISSELPPRPRRQHHGERALTT